jgi:hypothetical protein
MTIWTDDLSWCPSQCYTFDKQPDGTFNCLYLRWRHNDPWTGQIIRGLKTDNPKEAYQGEFSADLFKEHGLFFIDEQIAEAKAALLHLYKTGDTPDDDPHG